MTLLSLANKIPATGTPLWFPEYFGANFEMVFHTGTPQLHLNEDPWQGSMPPESMPNWVCYPKGDLQLEELMFALRSELLFGAEPLKNIPVDNFSPEVLTRFTEALEQALEDKRQDEANGVDQEGADPESQPYPAPALANQLIPQDTDSAVASQPASHKEALASPGAYESQTRYTFIQRKLVTPETIVTFHWTKPLSPGTPDAVLKAATRVRDFICLGQGRTLKDMGLNINQKTAREVNTLVDDLMPQYKAAYKWAKASLEPWERSNQSKTEKGVNKNMKYSRLTGLYLFHDNQGTLPLLQHSIWGKPFGGKGGLHTLFTTNFQDNTTMQPISAAHYKATAHDEAGGQG